MKRFIFILFFTLIILPVLAQPSVNLATSISWENNSLTINTTEKISYTEARLKDPDRIVIDILNCSLLNKSLQKTFKSDLDENISISEPAVNQLRIVFLGEASINRKVYLTNNEKTIIVRIARIDSELTEEKILENEEQTHLEKYTPAELREITIQEDDDKTKIIISATRSIKFNTYNLKNPDRLAIDLLNIKPPKDPLPKYQATPLVLSVRVGRAASGLEATRIVIDLARENLDYDVDTNLLGNKIQIELKINKEKEEKARKSNIKILIDPGHGGYDTGASYGGYEEKDITLLISEKLKKLLEEHGITAYLTRDDDSFLSLAERVEITNSVKPNVFISIHANAIETSRGIRGLETYHWTPQSQKLAYYVHKSILTNVQIPDHYIRKARFYVIKHTQSPAVLAELGFLSNREDRKMLTDPATQDRYTKALSQAILKFLDIEPKKENQAGEPVNRGTGETKKK